MHCLEKVYRSSGFKITDFQFFQVTIHYRSAFSGIQFADLRRFYMHRFKIIAMAARVNQSTQIASGYIHQISHSIEGFLQLETSRK